ESVGATATARLLTSGQKEVTFAVEVPKGASIDAGDAAAHIAVGCSLRGYRFDGYRTTLKKNEKPSLTKVVVGSEDVAAAKEARKYDMGGAAAGTGLMCALASRKARANVVGICGLVENMPDGKAQRPGDVVKSMSGQTIEILNTDAEGRLVLADALWYCQNRF